MARPLKYKTPEDMQATIDAYFDSCTSRPLINSDGNAITDRYGNIAYSVATPPTITGLALALGLNSRQALLNYQGRKAFHDAITRAKARVEAYAEGRLFDRDGAVGAKFALQNNYKGWADKVDVNATGAMNVTINVVD